MTSTSSSSASTADTEIKTTPLVAPSEGPQYPEITELMYAIAPHCQWDPQDQRIDADRDINTKEISSIIREYLKDQGQEKSIRDITGTTLHSAVVRMPLFNFILWIGGYVDLDDLKDLWSEGIQETKGYPFGMNRDEQAVLSFAAAQARVHEVYTSGEYTAVTKEIEMPSDKGVVAAVDTLLDSTGLPSLRYIVGKVTSAEKREESLRNDLKTSASDIKSLEKTLEATKEALRDLSVESLASGRKEVHYEGDGTIPEGRMVVKKASEVFPGISMISDLSVETYEWDSQHPDVPQVDSNYVFRGDLLLRVLYSFLTHKNAWLQGHTGSGKTTLIEQVCAVLGKPFIRVNLDSEISRFDLVGKDQLKVAQKEDGTSHTVSEFLEGVLPRALSMPCVLCMDEIDFIRPDVAYVLQSITEGKGMRLNEDGGRWIEPHPEFQICATANTVGQGDEHGMYQGARPQSMAFLDRFPVFIKVPYMTSKERTDLVRRHFPTLEEGTLSRLDKYVEEHIRTFEKGDVIQPITPRGMLSIALAVSVLGSEKVAFDMTVLDKASEDDRAALQGIGSRIWA